MPLPEQLGRLRRIDRIGAGGFATVWLYHDDELRSPVAVKALAENWAQRDDVRDRFLEEARILRRADSDHVVRVYDIGEADQTPYFVMSYADRGSLADHLVPGHPLPPPMVVDLVTQAAQGLDVLHRNGVVHRDIKPQNLLLRAGSDGLAQVLVADLGVAKAVLRASGLTQVVGTPAYMAPEQSTGGNVDTRADVHALGAVAYQMLTGRRVREGMESVAQGAPPVPPSRLVALPAAVDDVLMRALDPDPTRRWPGVLDFTRALHQSVLGSPPPGPVPVSSATSAGDPGAALSQWTPQAESTPIRTPHVGAPQGPTPQQAWVSPGVTPTSRRPQDVNDPRPPARRKISATRVLLIALAVIAVGFALSFGLVSLFSN